MSNQGFCIIMYVMNSLGTEDDNDQTIPNNLYHFLHVRKLPILKNLGHFNSCKCLMSSKHVFWHNDIKNMFLIVCINVFVKKWIENRDKFIYYDARILRTESACYFQHRWWTSCVCQIKNLSKTRWQPFRWTKFIVAKKRINIHNIHFSCSLGTPNSITNADFKPINHRRVVKKLNLDSSIYHKYNTTKQSQ